MNEIASNFVSDKLREIQILSNYEKNFLAIDLFTILV